MRTGILLANLGTPRSPEVADVREYLREFLGDPKVVQAPRLVWLPVLYGIILPFRAPKSAELYRRVWQAEGSPLLVHSRAQALGLAQRLGPELPLSLGMRYGEPGLTAAVEDLERRGCRRIVLLPMFPQWSVTTTGTLEEAAARECSRRKLELSVIAPFHSHPAYVAALAEAVRSARGADATARHVFSFHGLPEAYVRRGDPYREHCQRTAELLARALGLEADAWSLAFQSRFGPQPWLQPYLEEHLVELAPRHPRVVLATPGFLADCLETLEELGIRAQERFHAAGGRELALVPCLNERPDFLDALGAIVREHLERLDPR